MRKFRFYLEMPGRRTWLSDPENSVEALSRRFPKHTLREIYAMGAQYGRTSISYLAPSIRKAKAKAADYYLVRYRGWRIVRWIVREVGQ